VAELRADFNLQRAYATRRGDIVWLYVGYYGTERGGRPEHTPRGCYTGAGWGIESSRTIDITPDRSLRANEYLVTRDGKQRLVHFWFRSHRRTGLLGGFDQNVDRMLGRLIYGRVDGMLVRVSTPIEHGDAVSARGRLISFASRVDPLLADHWPVEHRCTGSADEACLPVALPGGAVQTVPEARSPSLSPESSQQPRGRDLQAKAGVRSR
jgi:EpsI family protein